MLVQDLHIRKYGSFKKTSLVWGLIAQYFGKLQGQKEQRSSEVKGASARRGASDWSRSGRLNLWRDLRPGVSACLERTQHAHLLA